MKNNVKISWPSHHAIIRQLNKNSSSIKGAINSIGYYEDQLKNCPLDERVDLERCLLKCQEEFKNKLKVEKHIQAVINRVALLN
jgi:hypothetical protein